MCVKVRESIETDYWPEMPLCSFLECCTRCCWRPKNAALGRETLQWPQIDLLGVADQPHRPGCGRSSCSGTGSPRGNLLYALHVSWAVLVYPTHNLVSIEVRIYPGLHKFLELSLERHHIVISAPDDHGRGGLRRSWEEQPLTETVCPLQVTTRCSLTMTEPGGNCTDLLFSQ